MNNHNLATTSTNNSVQKQQTMVVTYGDGIADFRDSINNLLKDGWRVIPKSIRMTKYKNIAFFEK